VKKGKVGNGKVKKGTKGKTGKGATKGKGGKKTEVAEVKPELTMKEKWEMNRYINKQRTLVFCSRGITHRDRHFLSDLRDLLPHSKKDVKFDAKDNLGMVNEVCELKSCNNCIFLESRKRKDLYMWVSKSPHGPSAKFLLQNVHTMSEVKLTGNCLKGSRPALVFDATFDTQPHYQLLRELFLQVFGSPKGHPKVKPFVDHILSFFIADGRIWFRNYQIVFKPGEVEEGKQGKNEPILVEIGPRFVLNPIRIFSGSLCGTTLWENPNFVSPNKARSDHKRKTADKYDKRVESKTKRRAYEKEEQEPEDVLGGVFK